LGTTYFAYGKDYHKQKKYVEAIKYYQLAIAALVKEFAPNQVYNNPIFKNINSKTVLLDVLQAKAEALLFQWEYDREN